ncbi:MAG: tonB-system energizer ExbB [Bauldia sp.]
MRDFSPLAMILNADRVVQAVTLILVMASIATWTIFAAKSLEMMAARRNLRWSFAKIQSARTLEEAEHVVRVRGSPAALLRAAGLETRMSAGLAVEGIKERVASRLQRIEVAGGRTIGRGIGVLATIGATAPFVGLFGTVWGIMDAFIGISRAETTNLAIVAPGIAEALFVTAVGLVTAIPAVVIYNAFSRSIAGYRAEVADISAEILRLVGRDLDRAAGLSEPLAQAAQ